MSKFAETLKRLMKERNVSTKLLSQAISVPQSTLSEWSAGREPRLNESIIKVAKFFGVSVEYLITGSDEESKVIAEFSKSLESGFIEVHQGIYCIKIEKFKPEQNNKPLRRNNE